MKIGIISDSHDHRRNVERAVELFNERDVAYVLHAGDIVSPFTARVFSDVTDAKFIAVYGNNDGEVVGLKTTIESFGGEIHARAYQGQIGPRRIFMMHEPYCLEEVVRSGMHDLVIYGHTHAADIRTANDALVVNPGESTGWLASRAHIAIVDLTNMTCEHLNLS